VIQTMSPISFSMASIIASAALGGGTYKTEASGFTSRTAYKVCFRNDSEAK
jgi:hypothetical protein